MINHILAPITYRQIFAPSSLGVGIVDGLVDDLFAAAKSGTDPARGAARPV